MLSVAELEQELDECGYDGNRIAREVAAKYGAGRVSYVHKTGAKTPDKTIIMVELDFRFLPDRQFEITAMSACLLEERLKEFGVPFEDRRDVWQHFLGLQTVEQVVNALQGIIQNEELLFHQSINQNLTSMNLNNLENLKEELKALGFKPKVAEEMQKQMEKGVPEFNLHDKVIDQNKQVDLTLHFKQSSQSEFYYLPKYSVALNTGKPLEEGHKYMVISPNPNEAGKNLVRSFENVSEAIAFFKDQRGNSELAAGKDAAHKVELARMENGKINYIARDFQRTFRMPAVTQTFFLDKGRGFTAEQAANLIQGRAVYRDDLLKLGGEPYQAWIKLNMEQEKDKYHNFTTTQYSVPYYGFVTREVLDKYHIKEMNDPKQAEQLARSLENGNRPLITVMKDGQETKLYLETTPRYHNVNFYQEDGKSVKREDFLKVPLVDQSLKLEKGKGKEQEKEAAIAR
jgi:flagellar hook-basal body complex protein FliE